MFWRSVGVAQTSAVEARRCVAMRRPPDAGRPDSRLACARARPQTLLERGDCTLEALLQEDELIQELKSLNSRVINLCARASLGGQPAGR